MLYYQEKILNINNINFTRITILNDTGLELTLDSLGASIRDIKVPNINKEIVSVTLSPYKDEVFHSLYNYHGKIIGRSSGRIKNATYTLNGLTAHLDKYIFNQDNLHAGDSCYAFKNFDYKINETSSYIDVIFTYLSKDNEGGYIGDISITITYKVHKNKNKIEIIFHGNSKETSFMNLTNHVYFNLSGNLSKSILDEEIFIDANYVGKLNKNLIVEEKIPVNKHFSFLNSHKFSSYILENDVQEFTSGYDHPYFLNKLCLDDTACIVKDNDSKIKLTVKTTYPVVVLYTNNYPTSEYIRRDLKDQKYYSFCLECQFHPDGINQENNRNGIFNKVYHEITIYEFSLDD